MIQGIKQDLNLNRKRGFYVILTNLTGLKVGTRRQVDSLFWQKQNPAKLVFPLIGFLKRLNLTEKVVRWKLE